jgi:hypothetical protein
VLDELRRVLAIDVESLTEFGFERVQRESRQHLTGPWSLPEGERVAEAGTAYPRPGAPGRSRSDLFVSGRSAFGRYLKREGDGLGSDLTTEDAQLVILDLFRVLEQTGLLTIVADFDGVPGYRLKASAIRWVTGDGAKGAEDPLRKSLNSEAVARVNPFFRALYGDVASSLKGLQAKEHTAQVPSQMREERDASTRWACAMLLELPQWQGRFVLGPHTAQQCRCIWLAVAPRESYRALRPMPERRN